ncbi:MAG TPA: DUF4255 domain-containing protein [Streptosporangiaceae bacterium]|jgi:hypothetical protein
MTSGLGVAATTAVLRSILENGFSQLNLAPLGHITVSALPPDRITVGQGETSTLNLFMYHATPNPGWRNVDLPSRDTGGDRVSNPPLALDLHYMMSAYGGEDLQPEVLLGLGAQLFHETPLLTRDAVRQAFTPRGGPLPQMLQLLATAGLDEQVELVKIVPEALSNDDLSKLWSVFGERYRPSAGFLATVVLIQGGRSFQSGLPVRDPRLYVVPILHPAIDAVDPPGLPLTGSPAIALTGDDLLSADVVAVLGSGEVIKPSSASTNSRLVVPLPGTVPAGTNSVQVIHQIAFSTPPHGPGPPAPPQALPEHRAFESNAAPFSVRPAIAPKPASSDPDITLTGELSSGGVATAGTVAVRVIPDVGKLQQVVLLLNQTGAAAGTTPSAYSIAADSRAADAADTTDTVQFPVAGVDVGTYLVRVRVDGVDSDLATDAGGKFAAPALDVP